ncbi:MAG: Lrp/AsnC family transcriptional regulator [Chloroflexi bacterium]|nr:Lrp/AsnC family transcriptional regulator [Chloroflexota bacterium]
MTTTHIATLSPHPYLDDLDLMLVAEMEANARQTITELAHKLHTNRATVRGKLQRLLRGGVIRVVTMPHPRYRGYRMQVNMGINALPSSIDTVAMALAARRGIQHVGIFTGRYDVMAWAVLEKPEDLSDFIRIDLAGIGGITRVETMVNLEMVKVSHAFLTDQNLAATRKPLTQSIDEVDLRLIKELRRNALQSQTQLAASLNVNTSTVGRRLQRLLDEGAIRIVAVANPLALGLRTRATIGINVKPGRVDAIADTLAGFRAVHHVLINTGQFDLIISADFPGPEDLSNFVREELGRIPGLSSHETMVCLKTIKDDFIAAGSGDRTLS